jgi:hypothetical protein
MEPRFSSSVEVEAPTCAIYDVIRTLKTLADTVPPNATIRTSADFSTPARLHITATWYETETERKAMLSPDEAARL